MSNKQGPNPADDEISLFELWTILVRRRWLIAIVFLVVVGVTAGSALVKEPENRLTAVIAVGQIADLPDNPATSIDPSEAVVPIEAAGSAVTRVNEALIPRVVAGDNGSTPPTAPVRAEVADAGAGLIRLTAEAPDSRTAATRRLMTRIGDRVVAHYRDEWRTQSRWLEDRIAALERRENAIDSRAPAGNRALMDRALGLAGEGEAASGGALVRDLLSSAMAYQSEAYRWDLADELSGLRLSQARMAPPGVERPAAVSAADIGARTGLMLALGAILGLMLGVFAAFIREFLANARAYREQPDPDQT
ncbi:Wzz/FepE/Etk N-terminal domain-containing protein [Spiribacter roseus]|uniref:Wzz/FepE/Etk N-terminal domain-containing protein n=1 Tax=Spiribacter roseus TaxID=1855875 RepID=UPI00132F9B84|nr:Wzz/FepE/Etk N-terminal domain-containing protein [Spiribacter roseus]KAF0284011.1 hypothetical protein BA898_02675 [Spiribacter roseus]